jgi:hypothetical protein
MRRSDSFLRMSIPKGPTEGGSGGKRGHSNTERWGTHQEVKAAVRQSRRLQSSELIREELESDQSLEAEARKIQKLLGGKVVRKVWRHRTTEIAIEFADGTRLFLNSHAELDCSIT